ncbi:MAG: lipopolysaccharide biosynthesis protein [Alphaproteobacteria bacterium]|nr:lipopolysaccharide biosynthesis protein [Alphaproteobacteria bacterium]
MSHPKPDQRDDLQALAKGGRTNVAGFFVRLIARIPFLIIGGQWYGAEALGRLAYAIIVVEFAAQIATLGLKRGLALHLTGDGKENGAWDGLVVVLLATLPLTLLLMAVPHIMFPNSAINGLDNLLPLVIPALAASDLMLAALAYRFDVGATVRARAVIEPWTISIGAFAFAWTMPRDGLLVAYALSMAAAFLASLVPFLKSYGLPKNWNPRPRALWALARRNVPLAAADAIEWGSRRLDLAILGLFVSPATVGIYWVAQQIASLPQKLKTSFDPVLGPVITRRLDEGDRPAVARQISQAGFWILAAQLGVALALGIPARGLLGLVGPDSSFVGGTAALAFLLLAEAVAALAVVSEAALVYIARHRNMLFSLGMIGFQGIVSVGLLFAMKTQGFAETDLAAAVAAALCVALALASLAKSLLARRLLGAPVSVWRWSLLIGATAAIAVGQVFIRLPEWIELLLGIPAILATYCWAIWTWGFREEDRVLFRRLK